MTRKKLTPAEIADKMESIPGWSLEGSMLNRQIICGSPHDGIALIVKIALISERLNHHPEITWLYDRLAISLTTHEIGNLSALDFVLAGEIGKLLDAQAKH